MAYSNLVPYLKVKPSPYSNQSSKLMELWSLSPNCSFIVTPVTWEAHIPTPSSGMFRLMDGPSTYCFNKPSWIHLTNYAPSKPFALSKFRPILRMLKTSTTATLLVSQLSIICLHTVSVPVSPIFFWGTYSKIPLERLTLIDDPEPGEMERQCLLKAGFHYLTHRCQ